MANLIVGKIESVKFTQDSFGEQLVTISGETYMTYWEIDQLKVGSTVEVEVGEPRQNCFVGQSEVVFQQSQAKFLRMIQRN